jgi:hypothetical protein
VIAAVLTLVLAMGPGGARASEYTDVLHVYQTHGSIPACQFSSAELSAALGGIDTYGQQYFADFSNAIQNALTARAAGACIPGASPVVPAARAPSAPAALPSSVNSTTDAGVPAPIVAMAAIAVVVATALTVRGIALAGGWEPGWTVRWRHAWGEAGYRVQSGWSDFVDWLRTRR